MTGRPQIRRNAPPPSRGVEVGWAFECVVPVLTVSAANKHETPMARHGRVKRERAIVGQWLALLFGRDCPNALRCWVGGEPGPVVVTLTRVGTVRGATKPLDDDNLRSAFKATRDEIAAWVGIDDGSGRLTFRYDQTPGGEPGVRIRVAGGSLNC